VAVLGSVLAVVVLVPRSPAHDTAGGAAPAREPAVARSSRPVASPVSAPVASTTSPTVGVASTDASGPAGDTGTPLAAAGATSIAPAVASPAEPPAAEPAPTSATAPAEQPPSLPKDAPALTPIASGQDEIASQLSATLDDAPSPITESAPAQIVSLVQDTDGHVSVQRNQVTGPDGVDAAAASIADAGDLVATGLDATVQMIDPAAELSVDPTATASSGDPLRSSQWALDRVPFETAWNTTNGAGVIVAVIDTAVDLNHAELLGQTTGAYHFTAAGQGPGVVTAPPGNFHGTHVSGIIAALAGNGAGIEGGAPGVKLMPIEVLSTSGSGRYSDITSAIIYAADHGARVINLSLGGSAQFDPLDAAVAYAVNHGAVVVAAAGNDGCVVGNPGCAANYPAASPGALAIGSVNSDLTCSSFTTQASYVSLGAPGAGILSTAPTNLYGSGYVSASGTSMATPYASAAVALVVAAHPSLGPAEIRAALTSTAVDVANAGPDTCTGSGLIDPLAALDHLAAGGGGGSPTTTAPSTMEAPRLAGALPGRGMVRLSFVAPPGASTILVRRDGVAIATIPATRRSYTDRNVSPHTDYTYELSAWSAALGEGPGSGDKTVRTRG